METKEERLTTKYGVCMSCCGSGTIQQLSPHPAILPCEKCDGTGRITINP